MRLTMIICVEINELFPYLTSYIKITLQIDERPTEERIRKPRRQRKIISSCPQGGIPQRRTSKTKANTLWKKGSIHSLGLLTSVC